MKKTKSKTVSIVIAIIMLVSAMLPAMHLGAGIIPPPHLAASMQAREAYAEPGQEIVVEFEKSVLTAQGWTATTHFISYDSTRLELISTGTWPAVIDWTQHELIPFWILMGGRAYINPTHPEVGGDVPGTAWLLISRGGLGTVTASATVELRFRVLDNAPAGEAFISWAPIRALADHPTTPFILNLVYATPAEEVYTSVMINNTISGEWYNASGEGWVFHNAGVRHMGWLQWEGDLFFMNPANNGVMVTSITMSIDGAYHIFDATGRWQGTLEGWRQVNVGWVYYVAGIRHMGWLNWNSDWYFMNPANQGAMVTNAIINIDGVYHSFNAQGVWQGAV